MIRKSKKFISFLLALLLFISPIVYDTASAYAADLWNVNEDFSDLPIFGEQKDENYFLFENANDDGDKGDVLWETIPELWDNTGGFLFASESSEQADVKDDTAFSIAAAGDEEKELTVNVFMYDGEGLVRLSDKASKVISLSRTFLSGHAAGETIVLRRELSDRLQTLMADVFADMAEDCAVTPAFINVTDGDATVKTYLLLYMPDGEEFAYAVFENSDITEEIGIADMFGITKAKSVGEQDSENEEGEAEKDEPAVLPNISLIDCGFTGIVPVSLMLAAPEAEDEEEPAADGSEAETDEPEVAEQEVNISDGNAEPVPDNEDAAQNSDNTQPEAQETDEPLLQDTETPDEDGNEVLLPESGQVLLDGNDTNDTDNTDDIADAQTDTEAEGGVITEDGEDIFSGNEQGIVQDEDNEQLSVEEILALKDENPERFEEILEAMSDEEYDLFWLAAFGVQEGGQEIPADDDDVPEQKPENNEEQTPAEGRVSENTEDSIQTDTESREPEGSQRAEVTEDDSAQEEESGSQAQDDEAEDSQTADEAENKTSDSENEEELPEAPEDTEETEEPEENETDGDAESDEDESESAEEDVQDDTAEENQEPESEDTKGLEADEKTDETPENSEEDDPAPKQAVASIFNRRTEQWFDTLYDAVTAGQKDVHGAATDICDDDVLLVYGETHEPGNIVIDKNITIAARTAEATERITTFTISVEKAEQGKAFVTIAEGARVELTGSGTDAPCVNIAFDAKDSGSAILNNGSLTCGNGVAVTCTGKGLIQNGEFALKDGFAFKDCGIDILLVSDGTAKNTHTINAECVLRDFADDLVISLGEEETFFKGRMVAEAGDGFVFKEDDAAKLTVYNLPNSFALVCEDLPSEVEGEEEPDNPDENADGTEEDGSGKVIVLGDPKPKGNILRGPSRNRALSDIQVLYDEGSADTAIITFMPNGGIGEPYTQEIQKSQLATMLYENEFTNDDAVFVGWGLSEYPQSSYQGGQTIHITGDTTLYAVWDEAPEGYTHLFNSATYGDSLVDMVPDGNGGWIISNFSIWGADQYYDGDPGSPTKIYIPATYQGAPITGIANNTFRSAGLKGVVFADDSQITSIGNYAFQEALFTKVDLPVSLETIGSYAFSNSLVKTINWTELVNLRSFGTYAFSGGALTSLDLSNTQVTKIPNSCFGSCPIANPILNENTTTLGSSSFYYRVNGSIRLPPSIQSVGASSFSVPTGTFTIDISDVPDSVCATIYPNLLGRYYDCISKTRVIFPDSWYDNNTDFIIYNGTIYGVKDSWPGGELVVPAGIGVTSIARGAFATKPCAGRLTSLIFEPGCGIKTLPTEMCSIQTKLKTIVFPDELTTIGNYAFYGCTGLEGTVEIPEGTITVGTSAFQNCKNIEEYILPSTLKTVNSAAFAYNYGLRRVTIGKTAAEGGSALTSFGGSTTNLPFYSNAGVTDIYVPGITIATGTTTPPWNKYQWGAVNAIVHWADQDSYPTEIEVVASDLSHWMFNPTTGKLTNFLGIEKNGVLDECVTTTNRNSITIPDTVYRLTDTEFENPMSVQSTAQYLLVDNVSARARYFDTVTVPGSMNGKLTSSVFSRSSTVHGSLNITTLTFEDGITSIPASCAYATGVSTLNLPTTIKTINTQAFAYSSVRNVTFPEGLETIGSAAFGYSSYLGQSTGGEIILPSTLKSINNNTFTNCTKITKIVIMQYLHEEDAPPGAPIAPASWEGNSFGAINVGNRVYFLDSVSVNLEQVSDEKDYDTQTVRLVVRVLKDFGVSVLEDPYIHPKQDPDIVDFHIISEDSAEWLPDYDSDWVYASLTVSTDKLYYFDAYTRNIQTNISTSSTFPVLTANNFGFILFDRNGGSGDIPPNVHLLDGTPTTIPAVPSTLKKFGYKDAAVIGKWNDSPDGTGTDYPVGSDYMMTTETLTLYPIWEIDPDQTYTVFYMPAEHGGVTIEKNENIQVFSTDGVTGSVAVPDTGYHVTGWYSSGNTITTSATLTAAKAKANLSKYGANAYSNTTFSAGFAPNTYTLKFNANGGTGTMADIPMTYDVPVTLPESVFEREGYEFIGWNTKANGSGDSYADEAEVINLTATHKGSVTLYAQWRTNLTLTVYSTGNMVNHYKEFHFTVTTTASRGVSTYDLLTTESVTIPVETGTVITITQDNYEAEGYVTTHQLNEEDPVAGYTWTHTVGVNSPEQLHIVFYNWRGVTIPTGINILPYTGHLAILSALAVFCVLFLITAHAGKRKKKR